MADSFVDNAIQCHHGNDTEILYAVVRNVTKQIRDVVNGEWDAHPASGSLDDYDISAGTASGGLWSGSFPEIASGFYIVQIRVRAGATPDYADIIKAAEKGYWNGIIFAVSEVEHILSTLLKMSDLSAGAPPVDATFLEALNYIYEAWRNKTRTHKVNSEITIYKDDGTTPLCESDISDDGNIFTKGEYGVAD